MAVTAKVPGLSVAFANQPWIYPDYQGATPSGEGASGVIEGQLTNVPQLGINGDRTKYKVDVTFNGEKHSGTLDENLRFAVPYWLTDDKPVGTSDMLPVKVVFTYDGGRDREHESSCS